MKISERKLLILNTIIKEHILTGSPVGSGVLVDKYNLNISPATVRKEMVELEEAGYIIQPHTSAGRIPAEKAYRIYLENLSGKNLSDKKTKEIELILRSKERENLKIAAKQISQLSGNAVFWAFHKQDIYYTGISNLFQQPEFQELETIYDISLVIDRIDEIIGEIFDGVQKGKNVFIGSENPFGNFCSAILVKYKLEDNIGLFGILGPMRMDYEKNLSLANIINNKFND
ncbi:MAG: hypothetical protein ABH881_01510 [bacterium]